MKKIMLFLGIIVLSVSCGKLIENWMNDIGSVSWQWYVFNRTEQTLLLKIHSNSISEIDYYEMYEINPTTDNRVYKLDFPDRKSSYDVMFGEYFNKCANKYGKNISWQILSEDEVVLKTWNYFDFEKPDKRFFEESAWQYGSDRSGSTSIRYFTFEILPKDIEQ
jgi:hypothetical protein